MCYWWQLNVQLLLCDFYGCTTSQVSFSQYGRSGKPASGWLVSCHHTSLVIRLGTQTCWPKLSTAYLCTTQNMRTTCKLNLAYILLPWCPQSAAALHCVVWCILKQPCFLSSLCVWIEFYKSLGQCACAHPCAARIDWGARLGPHSFEYSQTDSIETAFSHPNGFKAV